MSNNENHILTVELLQKNYFLKDENGHYWRDFVTHYLELIPVANGFNPVIVQLPEMSCDQEQAVCLPFIDNLKQLILLMAVITGGDEFLIHT